VTRYDFAFATAYRGPALLFGITPWTAWVELGARQLQVRFGPWRLRTPVSNVAGVQRTGGFRFVKTAGPPHLSFTDRGISFATNGDAGVCVELHAPVPGIDPTGRLKHPGVTLTVADVDGFEAALRSLLPDGS
jgi:hypothetical protein